MTSSQSTLISAQRLARLTAWTRLALMWFAMFLFAPAALTNIRRLNRFGFLSLDDLTRCVRDLIVIRAAQIMRTPPQPRQRFDYAQPGFRRRMHPRQLIRAAAGSRLRRALRHRDMATRISILLAALRDLDAFARAIARKLTRLAPILACAPPHNSVRTLACAAPYAADSS